MSFEGFHDKNSACQRVTEEAPAEPAMPSATGVISHTLLSSTGLSLGLVSLPSSSSSFVHSSVLVYLLTYWVTMCIFVCELAEDERGRRLRQRDDDGC